VQSPGAADDSEHGSNQPEPVVWIRSGQNYQDPGYSSTFGQQPGGPGYAAYPSPAARNSRPRGVMVVALVMLALIVALVLWLTFLS